MYKMSDELKDWGLGMMIIMIIIPGVLKLIISLFIEISMLESLGIVAVGISLLEGFRIITNETDPNIDEEDDQDDW